MKFDICLMNPPYTAAGSGKHYEFVERCVSLSSGTISIIPFMLTIKDYKNKTQLIKERLDKHLTYVKEIKSSVFEGTAMVNVAIYCFVQHRKEDKIKIEFIGGKTIIVPTICDNIRIDDYERNIFDIIKQNGSVPIAKGGANVVLRHIAASLSAEELAALKVKNINNNSKKLKNALATNELYGLIVSRVNGGSHTCVPTTCGQIFSKWEDFEKHFIARDKAFGYNVLLFNSYHAAENCRDALKRTLMRFLIYRVKVDQNMYEECYRYVPNIDWADDRTNTDEGILEMCGCPKDKIKEYAHYCDDIIYKVEKGERP